MSTSLNTSHTSLTDAAGYNHNLYLGVSTVPGGPAVKTLRFHCRERGFNPWLNNMHSDIILIKNELF